MTSTKLYCITHNNLLAIFHGQKKTEVASSEKVEFVNGFAGRKKILFCRINKNIHMVLESETRAKEFEEK